MESRIRFTIYLEQSYAIEFEENLLFLVDCVWGEWNKEACSATCGKATRTSNRIKVVKEANGGKCEGKATKIDICDVSPCPGNERKYLIYISPGGNQY